MDSVESECPIGEAVVTLPTPWPPATYVVILQEAGMDKYSRLESLSPSIAQVSSVSADCQHAHVWPVGRKRETQNP